MKDGYKEFFTKFDISEDKLLDFAKNYTIKAKKDIATDAWNNLKRNIEDSKCEDIYVRQYSRDGNNSNLYKDLYKSIFPAKINIDPNNNQMPTKKIEEWTGYNKKKNIQNYQVSHIFGRTKNPYAFCAPWNIVFIPKILDPFTGHESKGELTHKIQATLQADLINEYYDLINQFNEKMSDLSEKIDTYLEKKKNDVNKKFIQSVKQEFSIIDINNVTGKQVVIEPINNDWDWLDQLGEPDPTFEKSVQEMRAETAQERD